MEATEEQVLEHNLKETNRLIIELEDQLERLMNAANVVTASKGKEMVFFNAIGTGNTLKKYTEFTAALVEYCQALNFRLNNPVPVEGNDVNTMVEKGEF